MKKKEKKLLFEENWRWREEEVNIALTFLKPAAEQVFVA
jgi:hypothetical protein